MIEKIADFVLKSGLSIKGLDYSPVKGPEGNIEYLLYTGTDNGSDHDTAYVFVNSVSEGLKEKIADVVNKAHGELDK